MTDTTRLWGAGELAISAYRTRWYLRYGAPLTRQTHTEVAFRAALSTNGWERLELARV
jgi:hypothetical protein